MKLVILLDGTHNEFEEIASDAGNALLINTENCGETKEYRYLLNSIQQFAQSEKNIMLVKFSGKESISKQLGDECSEMVLTLSDNQNSNYYTECPRQTFLELLQLFNEENRWHYSLKRLNEARHILN